MVQEIKERNITLLLSDEDCKALLGKCGEAGLSVSQLLHNFIGDLIDASYSNGSDERMFANQWYNRCQVTAFSENTLLEHLILYGYEPEEYLDSLMLVDVDDDAQERIASMMEGWHPESEPDMDEQQLIIKEWVKERNALLG